MRLWLLRRPRVAIVRESRSCHAFRRYATRDEASGLAKGSIYRNDVDDINGACRVNEQRSLGPQHHDPTQSIRSRHLLRAILRECTYLPDPQARQWVKQHALTRFREYAFKAWKTQEEARRGQQGEQAQQDWLLRFRAKEKEARQALALLRRANEGERKCLLRVLLMAYGRIGKRRHELMEPLKPKKGGEEILRLINGDSGDSEETTTSTNSDADVTSNDLVKEQRYSKDGKIKLLSAGKYIPDLTPQLRALLLSQIQNPPDKLTRPTLRRLSTDIPELNTWHRPMPQKRIKNMQKKHYADLLERVLPPLPTEEWARLRDLSTGALKPESPTPRRARLSKAGISGEALDRSASALEVVIAYGKAPTRMFEQRNGHDITPRFLQRLYAEVFCQCPRMDWDKSTNKWTVTWGEKALFAPHTTQEKIDVRPDTSSITEANSTQQDR